MLSSLYHMFLFCFAFNFYFSEWIPLPYLWFHWPLLLLDLVCYWALFNTAQNWTFQFNYCSIQLCIYVWYFLIFPICWNSHFACTLLFWLKWLSLWPLYSPNLPLCPQWLPVFVGMPRSISAPKRRITVSKYMQAHQKLEFQAVARKVCS